MRYQLITPPAENPVSMLQVQDHLILDFDIGENVTQELIEMFTLRFERYTRRPLINQMWEAIADYFERSMTFQMGMVNEIVSVSYTDDTGAEHTIDPSNYRLIGPDTCKSLVFNKDFDLPIDLDEFDAVRIEFICGYGSESMDVPADIRGAIAQAVANGWENRGEDASVEIPKIAMDVFNAYRIINL